MQLQSDSRLGLRDGASSSNVSWAGGFVIFGVLIAGAMGGLYRRGRGGYAAIGAA